MTEDWQDVGAVEDVTDDEPIPVRVGDAQVGIYKVDGAFYALENVCPHAFAFLTDGFVDGDEIECPLHQALFHIPTGACRREPAERDLKTYEVKVEDGRILVKA